MWPFKSKKIETLQLPPLPPMSDSEDISLMPEEVPEELPPLEELNTNHTPREVSNPDSEEGVMPDMNIPPQSITRGKFISPKSEKFIMMDKYKELLGKLVSTNEELNNVDSEFSKIMKLKEEKDSKITTLQNSLEETSKKIMLMENTLFGG